FEYNEDGQVAKIYWEARAPFGPGNITGTDTHHYDVNGQLERIVRGAYTYNYIREGGLLVRQETVNNDVILNYTLYQYNENDNVIRQDMFAHQGGGKYAYSFIDYEY